MSGFNVHLLSAAAAAALTASASATTYHVNGTCGNDAWSGMSSDCAAPDGPKATIQAAINAAAGGDEIVVGPAFYGETIDFFGKAIVLRSEAGAETTVINGLGSGPVVSCFNGEGPGTVLEGFTVMGGVADQGGGMFNLGASPTIRDCVFTGNQANIGGAIRNRYDSSPVIERCSFIQNTAVIAGGAVVNSEGHPVIRDCLFLHNHAEGGGAAAVNINAVGGSPDFVNCRFLQNSSSTNSGGILDGGGTRFVNCVFSRNVMTGEIFSAILDLVEEDALIVNCTFGGNTGNALMDCCGYAFPTVRNSIIWGNTGLSVSGQVNIAHTNVEGGWPGSGNIDLDPLFVQQGTDDVRLSKGSPCVNAGNNSAIPSDITTDVAGNPRIMGGIVDMGAYEGVYEAQADGAGETDLDNGEFIILVPGGGGLNPMETAAVIVVNHSGPDDATFTVTEHDEDLYPGAGGHSELGCILSLETSLEDGQFMATLFVPMHLTGFDPVNRLHVNLTQYDAEADSWSLATAGNTVNSPGFDGPMGNRVVELFGAWGVTQEIGDYGIYWDDTTEQAFAWANVDVADDFGIGVALCPADCRQSPDGAVGVQDFLAMLARWGNAAGGGPCDIDYDAVIGMEDFLALLEVWGACGRAAHPAAAPPSGRVGSSGSAPALVRSADIDRDGSVGSGDVRLLKSFWGPCGPDCRADLNADGRIDMRDYLTLLSHWG